MKKISYGCTTAFLNMQDVGVIFVEQYKVNNIMKDKCACIIYNNIITLFLLILP